MQSLFWILFQIDSLMPVLLSHLVGFYHVPSPAGYFSSFSFCLVCCVWGLFPWWLRWSSVWPQWGRPGFNPWVGKIPWRWKWQPTPVLWPRKFHGWRSLMGYSPWVTESWTWLSNFTLFLQADGLYFLFILESAPCGWGWTSGLLIFLSWENCFCGVLLDGGWFHVSGGQCNVQ